MIGCIMPDKTSTKSKLTATEFAQIIIKRAVLSRPLKEWLFACEGVDNARTIQQVYHFIKPLSLMIEENIFAITDK